MFGFDKTRREEERIEDRELRKNAEGYSDPTAYEGIKRADAERDAEHERFRKVLGCILRICEIAGFHLEEHIVLRDIKTGKIWR